MNDAKSMSHKWEVNHQNLSANNETMKANFVSSMPHLFCEFMYYDMKWSINEFGGLFSRVHIA